MSGCGNDFIIIDNRDGKVGREGRREFVRDVCRPKVSVGADGVIFIENADSPTVNFQWDFYNADGSSAEMCANGARCAARYAYERKIAPAQMAFKTIAGVIEAQVGAGNVKIKLTRPEALRRDLDVDLNGTHYRLDHINTGVPHAVIVCDDVEVQDILGIGSGIRRHAAFAPKGTNVNFAQKIDDVSLKMRTYERGVEDETLACGTGAVAVAIVGACRGLVHSPVRILTRGGETLIVHFKQSNGSFDDVYLEGPTKIVFEGTLIEP
jgi:diaminopimelate epimerase